MAMQMRYLQALAEVAADKNSTIIFPLPIELLAPFLKHAGDGASSAALTNGKVENASLGMKDPAAIREARRSRSNSGDGGGKRPVARSCPAHNTSVVNANHEEVRTMSVANTDEKRGKRPHRRE